MTWRTLTGRRGAVHARNCRISRLGRCRNRLGAPQKERPARHHQDHERLQRYPVAHVAVVDEAVQRHRRREEQEHRPHRRDAPQRAAVEHHRQQQRRDQPIRRGVGEARHHRGLALPERPGAGRVDPGPPHVGVALRERLQLERDQLELAQRVVHGPVDGVVAGAGRGVDLRQLPERDERRGRVFHGPAVRVGVVAGPQRRARIGRDRHDAVHRDRVADRPRRHRQQHHHRHDGRVAPGPAHRAARAPEAEHDQGEQEALAARERRQPGHDPEHHERARPPLERQGERQKADELERVERLRERDVGDQDLPRHDREKSRRRDRRRAAKRLQPDQVGERDRQSAEHRVRDQGVRGVGAEHLVDAGEEDRIPRRPVRRGVAEERVAVAHRQRRADPAVEERVAEREADAAGAQVGRLGAAVGEYEREPQHERDEADPDRAARIERREGATDAGVGRDGGHAALNLHARAGFPAGTLRCRAGMAGTHRWGWATTAAVVLLLAAATPAGATQTTDATPFPVLVHDVKTGFYPFGNTAGTSNIQDLVQPDTQTEPSVAVNPQNPLNVVTAYQDGRRANGGDATNGYATSFDGGATWTYGELPNLTTPLQPKGTFERARDAVVAFGPGNLVYANSLVFDQNVSVGLRSGMAVNVSKDGGRTWSPPVIFQDDMLGGTNDNNWIVVDQSDAPGHHKGRVYVVWDRVAPVVYQYCDANCDKRENWLPTFDTLSGLVFPGQGIGAYPVLMDNGGLGIVIGTITEGVPTQPDEPEESADNEVFISAPTAGQTPYPAPLQFLPPVQIASNQSNPITAQRASDGLPAAAEDPAHGTLYAVWPDGRFRTEPSGTNQVNDVVIRRSTDTGQTWSKPARVNPGPANDRVNRYNATIAVGTDGTVYVDYRQRDQSGASPLFTPTIETYHQQSKDGGRTWTQPLLVDSIPSNAYYDAFSRDGSFEGDYNQTASVGGYTYVTRAKGRPASASEPPALTKAGADTVALTAKGLGHQHQSNWVSLIRDAVSTPSGSVQFVPSTTPGTPATPPPIPPGTPGQVLDRPPKAVIKKNGLRSRKAKSRRATGLAKDDH